MVSALCVLVLSLVVPSFEQQQETPLSPCPNVFSYEPPGTEPGRWDGVIYLPTDSTLHSLWLNIVLDRKADILVNDEGEVSTKDNTEFKIENTNTTILPDQAMTFRFFIRYSLLNPPVPKLKAIRLNGREICNADTPIPVQSYDGEERPSRPESSSYRPTTRQTERPRPNEQGINGGGSHVFDDGSRPIDKFYEQLVSWGQRPDNRSQEETTTRRVQVPRPRYPVSFGIQENPSKYFGGGLQQNECGKVVRLNPNELILNGAPTREGEWPWHIALYQSQTVDYKYMCGGTLVSHRHVITAAHCVKLKKYMNRVLTEQMLLVYLGKHNLNTITTGVQIRAVEEIIKHPQYNEKSFHTDLAILVLRDPVQYTDWVQPACLWPEDLNDIRYVINKKGSVVGWGIDASKMVTEELKLAELPIVDQLTCVRSYPEFFGRYTSDYTYCAGYGNNTCSSACNGDSGGGMFFKIEGRWYLRGLVSLSVKKNDVVLCDPQHYVIFTDLAKFLPWLKQHINYY